MEVDEEDVHELRDQINKLHSSSKDTFDDFMDAESGDDTPCPKEILKTSEEDDQSIIDDIKSPLQDNHKEVKDPTLCSSPKIHSKARKSITSPGLSPSKLRVSESPVDRYVETCRNGTVRSSLQSSGLRLSPTDSLAANLQLGLHIIEYHQQDIAPRKSFVGLSFDHFALNLRQSVAKVSSAVPRDQDTVLCSSCKKPVNTNENQTENTEKQIVVATSVTAIESASALLKV
jgi:kinesin family member 15